MTGRDLTSLDSVAFRDQAGVVAAAACAVHCAAMPLATGVLSAVGLGLLLDDQPVQDPFSLRAAVQSLDRTIEDAKVAATYLKLIAATSI